MSSNEIAEFVCLWGMLVPMALAFWGFILWCVVEVISDLKYKYITRRKHDRYEP